MMSKVSNTSDELVKSINKLIEDGLTKFEICSAACVRRQYLDEILSGYPGCHTKPLMRLTDAVGDLKEEAIYRVGVLELLFETIESGVSIVKISAESGMTRESLYKIIRDGSKPRGTTIDKIYNGCMAIRENQT